ncbi:MAG: 4Fe-4S binding protein [Methanoculleaceae archaeon]
MALNIGCSGRPGRSRENKTGSWRVFRPETDRERCNRCGICILLCPEGAITPDDDDFPVIDYDFCKGCGLCAEECPRGAIEMKKEEK